MTHRIRSAACTLFLAVVLFLIYSVWNDFLAAKGPVFRLSAISFTGLRVAAALFCAFLIVSQKQPSSRVAAAAIFIFFALMFFIKWAQHLSFNTHSHDTGLFHSALWNSVNGNWMFDSVRGQFYLADHLIFFLFLFVPFYWIYPGPETLYFLSALAFAGSAFGIYKLAQERLDSKLSAFLILAAFLTNRYVWGAFLHEFHPDFFAPLFLFMLFLAFYKKQAILLYSSLFCILILKEDYALYLIPVGVYFFIQKGGKTRGAAAALISAAYFSAAYFWILPGLQRISGEAENYAYVSSWAHLGSGPSDIIKNFILNPAIFFSSVSYKAVFSFFTKFVFLPLLSPSALLFLLPPLFLYTSSAFDLIRGLSIHYGLIPAAFGFIASVEALRNLEKIRAPASLALGLVSVLFVVGLFRLTFYLPMPEALEFKMRQDEFSGKKPLCVQSSLFPHLIPDGEFSIFPECSPRAKHLLLFNGAEAYPLSKSEFEKQVSTISTEGAWELKENSNGIMLFERKSAPAFN